MRQRVHTQVSCDASGSEPAKGPPPQPVAPATHAARHKTSPSPPCPRLPPPLSPSPPPLRGGEGRGEGAAPCEAQATPVPCLSARCCEPKSGVFVCVVKEKYFLPGPVRISTRICMSSPDRDIAMTRVTIPLAWCRVHLLVSLILVTLLRLNADARTLSAFDPRPAAALIAQIESLYHLPVTYEDTLYDYSGDIEDVTARVRRDHDIPHNANRTLVPKSFLLVVHVPDPQRPRGHRQSLADIAAALRATENLVDRDASIRGHQIFVIEKETSRLADFHLHVVARNYIDKFGHLRALEPLLDRPVSMNLHQQPADNAIRQLVGRISSGAALRVLEGTMPDNSLASARVDVDVVNKPAREVLDVISRQTRQPISWQLLCAPHDRECVLNIHIVPRLSL